MVNFFYYLGILCIVNELLPFIFKTPLIEIDGAVELKESTGNPDKFFSYLTKRWFRVIMGIIYVLWVLVGVFITEQHSLFVFLFILVVISPFVYFSIQGAKRQKHFAKADSLLCLTIISLILFNHFYLHVN